MLDEYLVNHCSPTLASIKTANLFRFFCASKKELENYLNIWNQLLNYKGVHIELLKVKDNWALLYVYRSKKLQNDLARKDVAKFLKKYGYKCFTHEKLLEQLKIRIHESEVFPHEIGLFLGYPLNDVIGFIENQGKNCKCNGLWKVYDNTEEAKKLFNRFNKCRQLYVHMFKQGKSVLQLTVAV